MKLIAAVRLVLSSRYTVTRRHEWRGIGIDRSGLWPLVTLGWWTIDTLGGDFTKAGETQATIMDHLRRFPDQPGTRTRKTDGDEKK